jgi:amino acid permease
MIRKLPLYIGDTPEGKICWTLIFSIGVVLPLSIPRSLSSLRYASFFGAVCSIYVVLTIVGICLFNRDITPELGYSLRNTAISFKYSFIGLLNSFPLVIFAFMY